MSDTPRLTDLNALTRNRARASETFLQREARAEVEDRLALVNRRFTQAAVVSGFPQVWAEVVPGARMVQETELLDLQEGAHDLVVHALGLHWSGDPVGQLIQCRRALRPDGLLLAGLLGGNTLHELRTCLSEAEVRVTGGLSPRVAPMAEIRDLGGLLQRAGAALPVADTVPLDIRYKSALHLMRDLRAMGEANALEARLRRPTRRAVLLEAARIYEENYPHPEGGIRATFEMIFLSGWAPDGTQPQPLRPGSATKRLSEALGTEEIPLGD
ncbi:hypothetical protein SAMN05421688_2990 [Poseidonocella pacifica]|uniref:Methyltransferase domain-containing protein n=1 Tax=Poseidonocella pacifica TaxID=871651 RepID=A0A1I0YDZ3_9RHOB|nr:SAM-dependent methyltransferase [Poseidonocella pacifica]SFB11585.1 hypothetical protein SAMN05421688_2990 [Poseidonocella pacifica]